MRYFKLLAYALAGVCAVAGGIALTAFVMVATLIIKIFLMISVATAAIGWFIWDLFLRRK